MQNPFKKSYSKKEIQLFRFLHRIPLFEKLNFDEMANFLPFMHLREYKQDEAVFFRGDPSHALYIVKNGAVSLHIDLKDEFEQLLTIRDDEAFGDNALLHDTIRIYHAIVKSEKANLYVIPQVNILEIFDRHPKIKAKMLESLALQYNGYTENLFKAYKSSFGFFDLSQVYQDS